VALSLSLLGSLAQAQTTSLRQQQIFEGDIAELIIEYESSIPSLYAVDTSILDKDFIVLDTQSSVSRVISEKRTMHRMHWALQLLPRRSGILQIPPLKFGENLSEPMLLEVREISAAQQAQQSVFVEIEAYPQNPYPGQQVRIVTRLFHNQELHDVSLAEPETRQRPIFRSGREVHYEAVRGNTHYGVVERSILLTANTGEPLTIEPATFRGSIRAGTVPASAQKTRFIYRNSNALSLPLRALPPGFSATNWLPARHLELSLDWDEMDANLRSGDSLGVTLRLHALGLPAEQLPADLLLHASTLYRIYADQETRSTQIEGAPGEEHFSSSLQQRYLLVFEQPGDVELPAVELQWWNLEQDSAAVASVAAKKLAVHASGTPSSDSQDMNDTLADVATGHENSARGILPSALYQHWGWLLVLALGLVAVLRLRAKVLSARILARLRLAEKRRRYRRNLKRACAANDARLARRELLAWGREHWHDQRINGLLELARRGQSARWTRELAGLDAAVFALQAGAWQGHSLWELIQQERKPDSTTRSTRNTLPGLYPAG
jgi:hypothetical protein